MVRVHTGRRPARLRILPVIALTVCLVASCANPVAPTGGPPDDQPPTIVLTEPEANATNVRTNSVRVVFSEYVDQGSFAQGYSITPPPEGRVEVRWRGRSVEILFQDQLPENTTYLLTIDTGLRDTRGVALKEPLTVAFSTGPEIDQGRLSGRVVDPVTGAGVAGFDVYAYRLEGDGPPDVLPERPDYRTQSGPDGQFNFTYLNIRPYFVIALRDQNRNRRPDPMEPFAVPPEPSLPADTTESSFQPWLVTVLDTIPPELQRVRSVSSSRLEARFSEPVTLTAPDPSAWALEDSAGATEPVVTGVYRVPEEDQTVFLETEPLAESRFRLSTNAVVDSAGNRLPRTLVSFEASTLADTMATRFLTFLPEEEETEAAFLGQWPGIRFNQWVDSLLIRSAVAVSDTLGRSYPYAIDAVDGSSYRIVPSDSLGQGVPFEVRVRGEALGDPDSLYTRRYRLLSQEEVGELSGVIMTPDTLGVPVVELYGAGDAGRPPLRVLRVDQDGSFRFDTLPEGHYHLRAFLDVDSTSRWNGGSILPYRDAEPLTWSADTLRVRPRWDTVLPDTLRIPAR